MNLYDLMYECLNTAYTQVGKNASYAVKRGGPCLYIFFEHSRGRDDWLKNLNFPARPYRFATSERWYAHRGFLSAWHELEDTVSAYIRDTSVKRIVIVGYSHGAAIALLCHEYVWFNRPDLRDTLESFGFGAPRVIWGQCCKGVAERFENFTVVRNIDDIVTHLPPAFLGYRHMGKLVTVGEWGKYSGIDAHRPENILAELCKYESARHLGFPCRKT